MGVRAARVAAVFATLTLLFGAPAEVNARDRYLCIPADGGNTYSVPGTCRSTSDQRQLLTEQEAADIAETAARGKPHIRCTAQNGSYSTFVRGDCPSSDDIRTIEYAKKPIKPGQQAEATSSARTTLSTPANALPPPSGSAVLERASSSSRVTSNGTGYVKIGLMVLGLLALSIGWLLNKFEGDKHPVNTRKAQPKRSSPKPTEEAKSASPTHSNHKPEPAAAKSDALNQKAQEFLAALSDGKELPGGLAFKSALQQANLDYSMESVDRVDRLLSQVRAKFSPQRESWENQPGTDNFSLMLAFYLGTMISRHGNMPIQWHTRDEALRITPSDNPIPQASWSRVVGVIGTTACVPLGLIDDALFGEPGGMTCKAYVERMVAKSPGINSVDENQRCAQMLESFFNDSEIEGGLAFRERLKQQQLDHSLASLERLDQLLRSLRSELKPAYTESVNKPDTQNFLRLVAFYIGMTVARAGKLSVKWLTFAEAKKAVPELEFQFETTSVCLLAGRFYFPLGLVTEILIQPGPQRTLRGWANEVLKTAPPPLQSILQSSAQYPLTTPMDAQWALAIRKAGFMAAWCMFAVEGGAPGKPTVLVPGEGDSATFIDFGFFGTAEAALQGAADRMEVNPEKVPFQIMSSDGYANLHTGRTDALTIELRIYAGGQFAKHGGFTMKVACPYRHADDAKGFAIYSPKLLECSVDAAMNNIIFKHFYLGIEEFKAADFGWKKYLDERV